MNAVEVRSVHFSYPAATEPVLRGVSADIPEGTVTAILGPNGVGKTTLLNLILGWLRPQEGAISIAGRRQGSLTRREMGRTLALVPQEEHIPFAFSVEEYVLLGRAPHLPALAPPSAADRLAARSALSAVDIPELAAQPVTDISGGERQLVMLARSLAQRPRILLLDEPTAHLDVRNKRRLANLIRGTDGDGDSRAGSHSRPVPTVILTTHDPEFAAVCADQMLLLSDGRTLAHGPVQEVTRAELLSTVFGTPVTVHWLEGRPVVRW